MYNKIFEENKRNIKIMILICIIINYFHLDIYYKYLLNSAYKIVNMKVK